MKILLFSGVFFVILFSARSQNNVDSLKNLLSAAPPISGKSSDTVSYKIHLELSKYYETRDTELMLFYLSNLSDTVYILEDSLKNKSLYRIKSDALKTMGNYNKNIKNYTSALRYYDLSRKMAQFINSHEIVARNLMNIGNTWGEMGNLEKAIENLIIAADYSKQFNLKEIESKCLISLGKKYIIKGDYPEAITYYEKSMEISKEQKNNLQIRSTCIVLGEAYSILRANAKAQLYYEEALRISKLAGNKNDLCADLTNMGRICYFNGKFEEAQNYYLPALDLARELNNADLESNCFIGLGSCCVGQEKFEDAVKYFEGAAEIGRKNKNDVQVLSCLANMGIIFYYQGQFEKAIACHEESIQGFIRLNYISDLPYEYFKLAHTSFLAGNKEKSFRAYTKSRELFLNEFRNSFAFLGESEKEEHMELFRSVFMQMNGFNSKYANQIDSLSQLCYDNELIFKGLMLKSSKAMADVIRNSSDTVLLNTYERLKQIRRLFSEAQRTGNTEGAKTLEMQSTEIEHKLANLCIQYADIQSIFNVTWKDVQKQLKKGEAAIEFSHYFLNDNKNQIYYVAFLITPDCKEPITIKLFMEQDLNEIIGKNDNNINQIQRIYGSKSNVNELLYNIIWLPFESYLSNIQTIYFTPSGILNNISFASLGKENKLLCDRFKLIQMSTTGKLINNLPFEPGKKLTAAVFGGINFNYPENIEASGDGEWNYLPGTLSEMNIILNQFKKSSIKAKGFSGDIATEKAFKNIFVQKGGGPSILHLATHGFFFPDPATKLLQEEMANGDGSSQEQLVEFGDIKFRGSDISAASFFINNADPMKRSGLIFAGANNINASMVNDTADEGILTAFEVSQLNMSNTALVALSACETRLGDIQGSEGVFGLQRAFKMAGVRFIIMSLWQVPDKETEEFMTDFYDRVLKTKDIRAAFIETQKAMGQKYDPYFWGAFVLIE